MSTFVAGYIVFSLLVLAGVNVLSRRKSQKTNEKESVFESASAKFADTEPEHRKDPSTDPSFIPIIPEKPRIRLSAQDNKEEVSLSRRRKRETNTDSKPPDDPHNPQPVKPFKPGQIMAVLLIGAFVTILNQTLINVALPHIMLALNVSANTVQWLVTGYMLVNGVLIPISAYLVEKIPTKNLFIIAMLFFGVGSLVSGVSPSFSILLVGRLIQAVGAGIIMPLMMNVFLTIFPPEQRGKAMGTMGLAIIFAPAIGPTLSGWLVENYNWRWLFFIVLPLAVIDIIIALAWLKNVLKLTNPKFDLWGVVFSTIGFGGLLYAFSQAGSNGWQSGEVIISLILSIVSLILFFWRELTVERPMLELRVFKYGIFSLTTIVSAVVTMAMFAAMILLPIYLQSIRGFSPLQSGLLLLPGALLMGIMSPIAGAIFDRIGARWLAVSGLLITVLTTWEFTKLTDATTYNHILLLYSMRMLGMSLLMMPIMTEGLNQLPSRLNSHGTAMANTMRQIAGSLGTALLVTIMTSRTAFHLGNYQNVLVQTNENLSAQVGGISSMLSSTLGLPAQAGSAVASQMLYGIAAKEAVISGINDSFIVATWIAAVALVLSFFIRRAHRPERTPRKKNPQESPQTKDIAPSALTES